MKFVSISQEQRRFLPSLNYVANIYHGIDVHNYGQPVKHRGYLAFVGRISSQKRPDLAIIAAAQSNHKLVILGKYKDESREKDYYENTFLPTLKKYRSYVDWVGEGDEKTVKDVLRHAKGTLLPVDFPEPFGLAAIESMASGCPVIAFGKGAYPETIVDGKTGFIVQNVEAMVEKIPLLDSIERKACKLHVVRNFSVERMVDDYIALYEQIAQSPTLEKAKHRKSVGPFMLPR
jgi:glycosyltransferase involved in cell wall biosynthesis